MNMKKMFNELCTPASVYLVISLGSVIIALFYGFALSAVAMQVIFVFAWTFLLNFLCRKGMKIVSWLLVLFPYLITLGTWSMLIFREGFARANRATATTTTATTTTTSAPAPATAPAPAPAPAPALPLALPLPAGWWPASTAQNVGFGEAISGSNKSTAYGVTTQSLSLKKNS